MATLPVARSELEIFRILEEGRFTEKRYCLPDTLRRFNVSSKEYFRLKSNYSKFFLREKPVAFTSRNAALLYLSGEYNLLTIQVASDGDVYIEEKINMPDTEPSYEEKLKTIWNESLDEHTKPENEDDMPPRKKAKTPSRRYLDSDTVHLIAQELLEGGDVPNFAALSKSWEVSKSTVRAISLGRHRFLDANGSLAAALRERFDRKYRRGSKGKQLDLADAGKPSKIVSPSITKPAKVSAPTPAPATLESQPTALVETRLVTEPNRLTSLLHELRNVMATQRIVKLTIDANGKVSVQREEIFELR